MKKEVGFILLAALCLNLVYASITVHNVSLQETYTENETLQGTINISLTDESYSQTILSSEGESVPLADLFTKNPTQYTCTPFDCLNDYNKKQTSGTDAIKISKGTPSYVGMVITASKTEPIRITSVAFDLSSDFQESQERPLSLQIFEKETWDFAEESGNYGPKQWGCFQEGGASPGPLIATASYCELIPLQDAPAVQIGAKIQISGSKKLKMTLYPGAGGPSINDCTFDPTQKDSCEITQEISKGTYQVCVGPTSTSNPTSHKIYSESSGLTCGFVYQNGPQNPTKDYGIFAQTGTYADASKIDFKTDFQKLARVADDLINLRYNRDCSSGCYLPIQLTGIDQNAIIFDVQLQFKRGGEDILTTNAHELDSVPATVTSTGIFNLDPLFFNISKVSPFSLSLDQTQLFKKSFTVLSSPQILNLTPLRPPAGIPVEYTVQTNNLGNATQYEFIFDENTTIKTKNNSATHLFQKIDNYTVSVQVTSNNLSTKKSFTVEAVSPRQAIRSMIATKKAQVKKLKAGIALLPSWYNSVVTKAANISKIEQEIARIEKEENTSSLSESKIVTLAKDIFTLAVPLGIEASALPPIPLSIDPNTIDPNTIAQANAESIDPQDMKEITQAILDWQATNIRTTITPVGISLKHDGAIDQHVLTIYDVALTSYSDENAFLVLDIPISQVTFEKNQQAKTTQSATVIPVNPKDSRIISFYTKSNEELEFYASPELSGIVLGSISETCNYNTICEEEKGENKNTCRNDCPPQSSAILLSVLALLCIIFLYTLLQIWYRRNYEKHLFHDRLHLYNLLMFVTNAIARGMTDKRIATSLKNQGWASERIAYVIKKARGKNTGLPEIIPITKIGGWIRKRKARKRFITGGKQHKHANINKQYSQNQVQ